MSEFSDDFWRELENDLQASRESADNPTLPGESEPYLSEPDDDNLLTPDSSRKNEAPEQSMPRFSEEEDINFGDTGPEDFHIDYDFDGEYRNAADPMPLSVRKERRTGLVGGLMYGIFVICIGCVLGCLLWLFAQDVLALGKTDSEIVVSIPADAFHEGTYEYEDEDGNVTEVTAQLCDLDRLSEIMYDNGLIRYKQLFKLFCKFSHADRKVGAGSYTLNTKYDYRALIYGTTPSSDMRVEVSVTIPEGYTLKQIINNLEEEGICTAEELWETAGNYAFEDEYDYLSGIPSLGDPYRLEGFLFPDTYYFYTQDDPVRVISKFLENFNTKFGETYIRRAAETGNSVYDVVTIASMIEREASSFDGERDLIASVIYNRINSSYFARLQIDATILYGMSRDGIENPDLDITYDTPYSTYLYEGLPPGPICNPGESSIRAALYPESTDYYYYALHKDTGSGVYHEFFTNGDDFSYFVNSDEYGG